MSLFQTQKSSSTTLYDTAAQQVVTLIGSGTICEGKLHAEGSTRIVGSTGKIEGNTKADNVFLAGEIHGNIDSSEGKTEISDTGKVVGDITTKAIVIDENAVFDGKCSMTSKERTTEGNTGNKEAKEQK